MITHRTLRGGWARCAKPATCPLRFHFPDMTPEQLRAVPETMVWEMCALIEPPDKADKYGRGWFEPAVLGQHGARLHRDYDLPAWIGVDYGQLEWHLHGERHRGNDRSAVIGVEGVQMWYREGYLHRDEGPALINRADHGIYTHTKQPADDRSNPGVITVAESICQWWHMGRKLRETSLSELEAAQ